MITSKIVHSRVGNDGVKYCIAQDSADDYSIYYESNGKMLLVDSYGSLDRALNVLDNES